jgi:hypothetical protein
MRKAGIFDVLGGKSGRQATLVAFRFAAAAYPPLSFCRAPGTRLRCRDLLATGRAKYRRYGDDIEKGTEWWSLEQQPAAYYRAAAARARMLQAEATTPRLKQYLGEVIARCERLAGEVESVSGEG